MISLSLYKQAIHHVLCKCDLHDWMKVCYTLSMRCDLECRRCSWQREAKKFGPRYEKCIECNSLYPVQLPNRINYLWHMPKCKFSKAT